ncbi:hypothetical protein [Rhizobium sp. NXC24]|uniref:hypothetical protein n=1 Tax=Rhizobium sp. NXC24 TaxID=2048897 RepID=UPI000CDF54A2|nr:hypothetical protein [Rhizobium sp. NXC24]AVA20693.1 hypothetical protein NXC24_CH01026 [Rhizobium sp. NXC24]
MRRMFALAVIALAVQSHPALATDNSAVSVFAAKARTDTNLQEMLFIAGEALSWANDEMATKANGKRLYCPPANTKIDGERYAAIFESYVKRKAWTQRLGPWGFEGYLLLALEDTFPCQN